MSVEKKSSFKPTPGQFKAIEHHGHDVLVAASAGSGKTKVLIERVLKQVIEQKVDLSSMLIVTFTEAAAKEMRERLTKELQKRLSQQLGSGNIQQTEQLKWLRRQLSAVNVADISTIHAFCLHLIQKYYYTVDIEPDFRLVSDDTERTLIRDDVWDTVRESFYQQLEDSYQNNSSMTENEREDAQLFEKLLQIFAKDRDDADFSELVMRADEFASATSDPEKWLLNLSNSYQIDEGQDIVNSLIWQNSLKGIITGQLDEIITNVQKRNDLYEKKLRSEMESYWSDEVSTDLKDYEKKKQTRFEKYAKKAQLQAEELTALKKLRTAVTNDQPYKQIKKLAENCSLSGKPSLVKCSGETKPNDLNEKAVLINEQMKKLQMAASDQLTKHLLVDYFALSDSELVSLLSKSKKLLIKFGQIVISFRKEYQKEKKRRHLLDFNDLEHYALAIVSSPTDESRQIRAMLQKRYHEIMVDEYQDTNGVQEALLTAIQDPQQGNMFMVGDVKQSIYRFRQADPALFNRKYHDFAELKEDETLTDQPGEKIILAENFRSVQNVADFTNLIFRQIMDEKIGEISYDDNASLIAGNLSYPPQTAHLSTDILVYESQEEQDEQEEQIEDDFEIDSKEQGQIYLVANKIKKLINEEHKEIFDRDSGQMRPLEYSDIAILASTHGDSLLIAEEFKNLEIPVNVDNTNNYFKTIEIQIMMSLLEVIDNPHQDIPLVAVLRSPLYQFDENELAYLRIHLQKGDFYQTLTDFRYHFEKKQNEDEFKKDERSEKIYHKVTRFLDDLTSFRVRGRRNDLATLIWSIYSRTGFLDYAGGMPGGQQRQANLHALYERAADYEKMSYKGIFQFVRFIKKMQEKDHDLAEMSVQDGNNAVSFMTIHKSKGLEYPVVFLINAHKQFNLRSISSKPYVLDDKLGMGIDYVATEIEDGREIQVKTPTPVKVAIKEKATQKAIAEEMRKLYVALTRAEQKIYIVGESKTALTALENWVGQIVADQLVLSDASRKRAGSNYLDWIGAAIIRSKEFSSANIKRYTLTAENEKQTQDGKSIIENADKDQIDLLQKIRELKEQAPEVLKDSPAKFKVEFWDKRRLQSDMGISQAKITEQAAQWAKRQSQSGQLPADYSALMEFKYPDTQLTMTTAYQSVTDIKRLFEDPDNDLMGQVNIDQVGNSNQNKDQNDEKHALYLQHGFERPLFMMEENNVTPAQVGTATHLVFQKLPLTGTVTRKVVEQVIADLCEDGLLSNSLAAKISIDGVVGLYQTKLGAEILQNQAALQREAPIAMLYPAGKLFDGSQFRDVEQPVLIHGIIDGYFTDEQNKTILFDYKTDHVPANGSQKVAESYRGQLNLYGLALQSILGKDARIEKYIYLVETGEVIRI